MSTTVPAPLVDADSFQMQEQYDFLPEPPSFFDQVTEMSMIRDNPAIRITFPEVEDREVFLISDPGNSYYTPAVLMIVQYIDSEHVTMEEYIEGGQSNYGCFPITVDEEGKFHVVDDDLNDLTFDQLVSTKEGVHPAKNIKEFEEVSGTASEWSDSNGKLVSLSILPHLNDEALEWLKQHAPKHRA